MLLQDRTASRRVDYSLALLAGAVFLLGGLGTPGFWEPWESGLVQLAQFVQLNAGDPSVFWVPQNENHLAYKPLALIWSLAAIQGVLDDPSEFALRLPGALLGLSVMLTAFALVRRFFTRTAAFATLLALVSLPMFVFGARLLAGGIWLIAGVALPLMLYLLATYAETRRQRGAYGAAFGASWLLAFLGGGLFAWAIVAAVLGTFLLWVRKRHTLVGFFNLAAVVSGLLAFALSAAVFLQYRAQVPYALEDRLPLDAGRLTAELEAGRVEAIGLRHGVVVGLFQEDAWETTGAERFVLSLDGRLHGTELWRTWVQQPRQMKALWSKLEAGGWLEGGELPPFDVPPPAGGATKAALQFFAYDLYDPAVLAHGDKARVRSLVAVAPALGIVRDAPETLDDLLARLTGPWTGAQPSTAAPDVRPAASAPAAQTTLKTGQEVTVLGPAEQAGWLEVEVSGTQTGFVRAEALDVQPALAHAPFVAWVRHVGFGLFPWVLLLPLSLGLLALRRTQDLTPEHDEASEVGAFMLAWFAVSILALGVGTTFLNNKAFVGVVPVAIASGMLLGSTSFWARLSAASLARKFVGFGAICLLAVLIHDYKEHPWLFIETYLGQPDMEWEAKLQVLALPFKTFRAVVAILLAGYFFGAIGFGSRLFGRTVALLRARFDGLVRGFEPYRAPGVRWGLLTGRERLGRLLWAPWGYGLRWPALGLWHTALALRSPRAVLVVMAAAFALLSVFLYLPAMSHHLTQKGLLLRYSELAAPGEPLVSLQTEAERTCRSYSDCESGFACVRGRCKPEATSFYLGHIDNVRENDLIEAMTGEDRTFAIVPRKKLARVNAQFRKQFPAGDRRNLAVLDTRSSRFLLVSNRVEAGEQDENYIAAMISDAPPSPEYVPNRPVRFTNGLEFVGYDLDPDEVGSGEELTITYYYHVTQDITQDWQAFLHIDYPGNRINGDHYPGAGEFHTNTWLAGDYVKDVQKIDIDRGSSAGIYELWFGFFSSGDNRLKVETGDTDGGDRVRMGTLRVTGGI